MGTTVNFLPILLISSCKYLKGGMYGDLIAVARERDKKFKEKFRATDKL